MRYGDVLRLAHELKKQLHEVMGWPGPMTARQALVWRFWLRAEQDRPSRADWYAVQTAGEVRRLFLQRIGADAKVDLNSMVLRFGDGRDRDDADPEGDEELLANQIAVSKSMAKIRGADPSKLGLPARPADQDEIEGEPLETPAVPDMWE